jgi:hypothetical protein
MTAVAGVRGPSHKHSGGVLFFAFWPFDDKSTKGARVNQQLISPWRTRCVGVSQVTDTWPMHACMHASSAQRTHRATARARAPSTSAAQGKQSDTLLDDALGRPKTAWPCIHACMHRRSAHPQMCGSPPARNFVVGLEPTAADIAR